MLIEEVGYQYLLPILATVATSLKEARQTERELPELQIVGILNNIMQELQRYVKAMIVCVLSCVLISLGSIRMSYPRASCRETCRCCLQTSFARWSSN